MIRLAFCCLLALAGATILGMFASPSLLSLLTSRFPPMPGVVVKDPSDMFVVYLKLAFVAGIGLALPIILYELRLTTARSTHSVPLGLRRLSLPLAGLFYYFGIA